MPLHFYAHAIYWPVALSPETSRLYWEPHSSKKTDRKNTVGVLAGRETRRWGPARIAHST